MMLYIQSVTYAHPNKDVLFSTISLNIGRQEKIALTGNNGAGKSTLLKLMAGFLQPVSGVIRSEGKIWYVPQLSGEYTDCTVAEVLQIHDKLKAFHEILSGNATEEDLAVLDDDWTIEERCREALDYWKLNDVDPDRKMSSLSGGQKTKVFLSGIYIHQPDIVLLDEPSNHLDNEARGQLYEFVRSAKQTLVIVSHDRTLMNLLDMTCELGPHGLHVYGGNYDFYAEQRRIEKEALNNDLKSKEKALRKARETEKEAMERQQKLNARGKKKQEKSGMPTIMLNTLRNNAEKSTARLKDAHAEKTGTISGELNELRSRLSGNDQMKLDLDHSSLHTGKILIRANAVNKDFNGKSLWHEPLSFQITSGGRFAVAGANGSGKTTLIRMILGSLEPDSGTIVRTYGKAVYIDQDYALTDRDLSVYELAQEFNTNNLQEHEVKIRLNRFLFTQSDWDKSCRSLSGGEKMRLMLCCLAIGNKAPDLIVLDEPTNNLDIRNTEILTAAIAEYEGTLLVVSHDAIFLEEIGVNEQLTATGDK